MTLMRDQLPHRGMEEWKWSDLRAAVANLDDSALEKTAYLGLTLPRGVDEHMATDLTVLDGSLSTLAAAHAPDAMAVIIPDGEKPEQPLEITPVMHGNARMVVEVGVGAELSVIERYSSTEGGFSNLDIRYVVKEGGTLNRTVVTDDHEDTVRNVAAILMLWKDATFNQTLLTTGAKLMKLRTMLACMGPCELNLSGAYMLAGKRHVDVQHYTDLTAPGSVVRDEVAGIVTDKARGVFQGKFHVRRPAQQTDAEMRHDALMLSDTAKINAKPELEIYADDVECAHGNTIGQLDEQALFYMRQRGIPEAQARALLIEAFIAARLGDDEDMLALVRDWLAAQS